MNSKSKYKDINDLPLALTVKDVQEVLGICRQNAYQLCLSNSFPHKKIGAKIVIPKPGFVEWLVANEEIGVL